MAAAKPPPTRQDVSQTYERVATLDETYRHGEAHLYLGVIDTLLPPAVRLLLPSETLATTKSGNCVGAVTVIWIGVEVLLISLLSLT